MGLMTKEVWVELCGSNMKWFEDKGYEIPKAVNKQGRFTTPKGTKIIVNVFDLSDNSPAIVSCECDGCGEISDNTRWQTYIKSVKEDGKYYCNKCALKLYGHENARLTILKNRGSISITHPHLIKYFLNKEDAEKYSAGSNKRVSLICPDCKTIKNNASINGLSQSVFSCLKCSDHVSYPEKFFGEFLRQTNTEFQAQLTKPTFEWCDKYKYDFYVPLLNFLAETHGIQHYEETNGSWDSLSEIQENDLDKEWLARENKIKTYIILNCQNSNMEWIKNNILKSKLPTLLNFKEEDIDWLKCHEYACVSLVKLVCEEWNNGIKNTKIIGDKLKLCTDTVIKYLKQGVELGWCDYDPKKQNGKSIICLTTGEVFNSISNANRKYNINISHISECCKSDKTKSAGKHPETGEKMTWEYYDKYLEQIAK